MFLLFWWRPTRFSIVVMLIRLEISLPSSKPYVFIIRGSLWWSTWGDTVKLDLHNRLLRFIDYKKDLRLSLRVFLPTFLVRSLYAASLFFLSLDHVGVLMSLLSLSIFSDMSLIRVPPPVICTPLALGINDKGFRKRAIFAAVRRRNSFSFFS